MSWEVWTMRSKTRLFNGTVFRKDLTRFAPVWLLYALGLVMGIMVLTAMDARGDGYWLANDVAKLIGYGGIINMVYALVVAMLLFGDLYNTRMCSALHALPLRREAWFTTHVVSGLVFSLLPTAIMTVLSLPLLMTTCVERAWHIGLLWFLATNLEFLCFFGMAVFCAFFTGMRLPMAILYAAGNGAPYVVCMIIDRLYTPMLYGVITPTGWVNQLMPLRYTYQTEFLLLDDYQTQLQAARESHAPVSAAFRMNADAWTYLVVWAVVGLVLLLLALVLYRRRRLECVGEAMVIRRLDPVFQSGMAIAVAFFAYTLLNNYTRLGYQSTGALNYFIMFCGLAVGWFGTKMLIAHTPWIFRPRSILGLVGLTAMLAGSLVATRLDILGLDDRIPAVEDVASVNVSAYYTGTGEGVLTLTQDQQIEDILLLQERILEDRVPSSGRFPIVEGQALMGEDLEAFQESRTGPCQLPCRSAAYLHLTYRMNDGSTMRRSYNLWSDSEAGDLAREYLSRPEVVLLPERLESFDWEQPCYISASGGTSRPISGQEVQSLLDAIRADCQERTIAQCWGLHQGYFVYSSDTLSWEGDPTEFPTDSVYFSISSGDNYFSLSVFADSRHTLRWMYDHALLEGYTVHNSDLWYEGVYYAA